MRLYVCTCTHKWSTDHIHINQKERGKGRERGRREGGREGGEDL